jgi:hypothetical protein
MNEVSCRPLNTRWFHGVKALLVIAFAIFCTIAPARADHVITGTDIGEFQIALTNGGLITFQTNVTYTVTTNLFVITNDVQIDGSGFTVTFNGSDTARLFYIATNVNVALTNVTVSHGHSTNGGAIYNNGGNLVASNVFFVANTATNRAGGNGQAGRSGHIAGGDGGAGAPAYGGAIYNNHGSLFLQFCTFSNNVAFGGNGGNGGDGFSGVGGSGGKGGNGAPAYGGAIYNNSVNATVLGSYFFNNNSIAGSGGIGGLGGSGPIPGNIGAGGIGWLADGGAIYNAAGSVLRITNSSFVGNTAAGGATAPQGITFNGLTANGQNGGPAYGGAIFNVGKLQIVNCTLFQNQVVGGTGGNTLGGQFAKAGSGGTAGGAGIANTGFFLARNCTFATNNAFPGTNGVSPFAGQNGTMGLVVGGNLYRGGTGRSTNINCILQHGLGPNSFGGLIDGGFNISSDASCAFLATSTSLSKTSASLTNTLVFFTNQTFTCGPLLPFMAGSPAQDRITNGSAPETDQRGALRMSVTNVGGIDYTNVPDVGSFELEPTAPIIVVQPQNQAPPTGKPATFRVSVVGAKPLTYQWFFTQTQDTNNPAVGVGTNGPVLTVANQPTNFGSYFVVVTNYLGSATSDMATFTNATLLSITNQPVSLLKQGIGATASFTVGVKGNSPNFRWFFNNQPLPTTVVTNVFGTNTATLTITNISTTNVGSYYVLVTNSISRVQSRIVTLTIGDPAFITTPTNQTVADGSTVTFTASASSTTNINFVWNKVSPNPHVVGTNGPAFTISPVRTNDAGSYNLIIKNAKGSLTNTFTLTVIAAPFSISGTVLNFGSGLGGVNITNGNKRFVTTSDGKFSFGGLTNGTYTLMPDQSTLGIIPTTVVVTVDTNNPNPVVNFEAVPAIRISAAITNDTLPIQIFSTTNHALRLQASTTMSNDWVDILTNIVTTTNTANVQITNISTSPKLFLRVVTP